MQTGRKKNGNVRTLFEVLWEQRRRISGLLGTKGRIIEKVLFQLRLRSGQKTNQKQGTTMLTYCQKKGL